MKADTTEKGLESLTMRHMTGTDGLSHGEPKISAEAAPKPGGNGWFAGSPASYDRKYALDSDQLFAFFQATSRISQSTAREVAHAFRFAKRLVIDGWNPVARAAG